MTPTSNDNPTETDIFNWDRVKEFCGGNEEVEIKAIGMFQENIKKDIEALERHLADGDQAAWGKIVHKIYGSASNIGASALARVCDDAQTQNSGGASGLDDLHRQIVTEHERLARLLADRP